MVILKVILIIVLVLILAFILNGIEDYHKENSLIRLSFADKLGKLKLPIVSLVNNGRVFNFLIDSGATYSIIDTPFLEQMSHKKLEAEGSAYGVDGNKVPVSYARIELTHDDYKFVDEFQIIRVNAFDNIKETDGITIAGILGTEFLQRYNFIVNFKDLIMYTEKSKSEKQ